MTNLSLINQMVSELVICLKGVFCRGQLRTEEEEEKRHIIIPMSIYVAIFLGILTLLLF